MRMLHPLNDPLGQKSAARETLPPTEQALPGAHAVSVRAASRGARAAEPHDSQCQNNVSKMMIGMGIPSSQSKIPRPIAVLLREMREGQFAPTQLKGPGVADRAPPPSPGIRFRIDQALASIPTQLASASCVTPSRAAIVAIIGALKLPAGQRLEADAEQLSGVGFVIHRRQRRA